MSKESELRELNQQKAELHRRWGQCHDVGDRLGMQRLRNEIRKVDKKILKVMDSE